MRANQSNYFPWGNPVTADAFIKEIKPTDRIASVSIMNVGNAVVYLWTHFKIEIGGSLQLSADQTAYLSLSKVPVHFDLTGSPTNPKLAILAERVTEIRVTA